MANLQQPRPAWFRLYSLAGRGPAPAQAPAPARPAATGPSFSTKPTIQPTQTHESVRSAPAASSPPRTSPVVPAPKFRSPGLSPPSPIPTSSVPKRNSTAAAPVNGNGKTATPSPKITKTIERSPARSRKTKPSSHPPSPHHQEQPKVDQKSVLVQHGIDKPTHRPRSHSSGGIPSNGKRESVVKDNGTSKKVYDPEEVGTRLVTLAGENKGAVMELTASRKKGNNASGIPNSLGEKQGTMTGTSNEDQTGSSKGNMRSPMVGSLNSNVQGLNNSIIYNCSFKSNDPGIRLSITRKGNGNHLEK